jgi:hypothetical protein
VSAGRPTKYDPAYCEQVIQAGEFGLSLRAFAGQLRVARSTINEWMGEHPEFAEAIEIYKSVVALAWEERQRRAIFEGAPKGAQTLIIFGLKNMAADEWRDRREVEHTGADGGPVQTSLTVTFVDPVSG